MESFEKIEVDPAKLKVARGDRPAGEIARKLGISYQYLWMIETGRRGIDGHILARMCLLYGVQIADLLSGQGEKFFDAA